MDTSEELDFGTRKVSGNSITVPLQPVIRKEFESNARSLGCSIAEYVRGIHRRYQRAKLADPELDKMKKQHDIFGHLVRAMEKPFTEKRVATPEEQERIDYLRGLLEKTETEQPQPQPHKPPRSPITARLTSRV